MYHNFTAKNNYPKKKLEQVHRPEIINDYKILIRDWTIVTTARGAAENFAGAPALLGS